MTIQSVLNSTTLDSLDTELLLAFTLKKDRAFIKAHPEQTLTLVQKLRFFWYTRKRANGTPLSYITGHKEFYGLDFEVNKHTLVPRPETEQLVALATEQVTNYKLQDTNTLLLDIGTGSGCIPIAIANTIKQSDGLTIIASDISKPAIATAKRNAKKHNISITFTQGNLLDPVISEIKKQQSNIIITANLPYITEQQFADEPSIKKEPYSALVAKENGLALYRELLEQLNECSINAILYFEIDPEQKSSIQSLIQEYYKKAIITVHDDLCGHARIVEVII